ncbi:MAG: outer membrane lipoprotein-sorting protein [Deltaproteobacteria bacterium]|nr:outer membrane lipoprotein-sorting protein [Deltaproteobacteria bacterium]
MKKYLLTILTLFLFISPSFAYLPDSPFLLELVTEKLGKPDRIEVYQNLEIFDDTFDNGFMVFKQNLKYNIANRFRSVTKSKEKTRIHIYSKGSALTILDSLIISEEESKIDYYKDILLIRDSSQLFKRLKKIGIDMLVSSLGQFKNRLSYIIGAANNDFSASQLWVDKESLMPSRLIIVNESNKLEIHYNEWKRLRKTWYPRRIDFYENDILTRIIRVDKIALNPKFKKNIFDIEYLKQIYVKEKIDIKDDDVKNAIDKFDKRF